MSSHKLPNIPSLRKHQLLLEFASLKHAPPPGIYVSINSPGDPTLWTGVFFVRSGPYASAILRFHIRFPPSYPDLPPLVTFTTDIFHPLLVPLTTYTFTTGSSNEAPVSATDEERLPPGGFSLRHGFPHWFGRGQRTATNSAASSRNVSGSSSSDVPEAVPTNVSTKTTRTEAGTGDNTENGPGAPTTPRKKTAEATTSAGSFSSLRASEIHKDIPSRISPAPAVAPFQATQRTVPVVALLNYIRSTFDDEIVLDSLRLEAAGNPGAWHSWRAHRRNVRGVKPESHDAGTSTPDSSVKRVTAQARLPGEWNWEGVWAKRVQSGIEASQSDAMLFGNVPRGGDDTIRFLNMDAASLEFVKERIIPRTEEVQEVQRVQN